jgi:phospholipid-transporting ATPase
MRYNTEGEDEEISNVNFDDPTFYSHFRDKGSVNYH